MKLSADNRGVEYPFIVGALTDGLDPVPDFEERDAIGLDVVSGRVFSATCRPVLSVSDWAVAAFAPVPDFAEFSGGAFGLEGFSGAGTERSTRSLSSPAVIEILRLVVMTVSSAFNARTS